MAASQQVIDVVGAGPDRATERKELAHAEDLVQAVQELSLARDLTGVQSIVGRAARRLTGADGASLVLRDGDQCHYLDEDAIAPLWKGRRFPIDRCVSGWAMLNSAPVVIPDIATDERIPQDVYWPTFVRSIAMMPIRTVESIGAIGVYWARPHEADRTQLRTLQALASSTAVTLERLQALDEVDAQVARRTSALEQANEVLANYASIASHDLRSPLATVLSLLAALEHHAVDVLDVDERLLLERAQVHTQALLNTVDALLELSRIEGTIVRGAPVDLDRLVDRALDAVADQLENAGATVRRGPLPTVEGDPALLRVLLDNLIANATKFRSDERALVIDVDAGHDDGGWWLAVTDTGRGIDPSDHERIFELFGRTANSEKVAGAGIGLATCRRICEQHGGSIHAEPHDAGTRFVVRMPGRAEQTPGWSVR